MRDSPLLLDPNIAPVFGGVTRSRTLAVLSNATAPMTGYRVAITAALQPIKTSIELRRLSKAGIVSEAPTPEGRMGWVLADEDLRNFFRRRMRISWLQDWDKEVSQRAAFGQAVAGRMAKVGLRQYSPTPKLVSYRTEFQRSTTKDRALERAGLPASRPMRGH
jgi:hypothetical protein